MKVYELMERLAVMPAGLEVKADTQVPIEEILDIAEDDEKFETYRISGIVTKVEPRQDNSITLCFEWVEAMQQ